MKSLISFLLLFFVFVGTGPLLAYDNVLIVTVDTLRADYVGCNGSKKVKTPNIDSLASSGVVFRNTVSPAPFTLPSHVSLMTGLIPPVHGVRDNGGFYLNEKIATLAESFKARGAATAAFVGGFPLDSRFGLNQGFDVYDDSYPTTNNFSEISVPQRPADEVADSALRWLRSKEKAHWFLWVHFYDAHFPYTPPERFRKIYPNDLYAGEVAFADEQIGRLLDFLKQNHLEKSTLVVVTADHGESLGEHGEETHGIFAYESTLRIPLIMAPFSPRIVDTRVRLIDVAPTILELQNIPFPAKMQGVSLLKCLNGKENPQLQDSYFEALSMSLNAGWAPLKGFYSGTHQYISLPIPEVYDLSKDLKEQSNLCADQQLCKDWGIRFGRFNKPLEQKVIANTPVDRETQEQLKALGYLSGGSVAAKSEYSVDDDPKKLIIYHNRVNSALSFYNKGYDLKALEILEKVIAEKPDYSTAYLHAAYIQDEGGSPEKAVEVIQQLVKRGNGTPETLGKLGFYLYEDQKYETAIQQLKAALKLDPQDLQNLNFLGMAYTAMGNFDEAEKIFNKALTLDPSAAMTLNNLGTLYLTQKKFDMAAQKLEAALALNPHIANAYNGLGVVYAKQNKWDLAIKNWDLAVRENPKNYDAMLNLAYAYLEIKQRDKALPLFQNFEKNAPVRRYSEDLVKVRQLIRQLQTS